MSQDTKDRKITSVRFIADVNLGTTRTGDQKSWTHDREGDKQLAAKATALGVEFRKVTPSFDGEPADQSEADARKRAIEQARTAPIVRIPWANVAQYVEAP